MLAEIIERRGIQVTVQVTVEIGGSLLKAEEAIVDACNEVGWCGERGGAGAV